MNDVHPSPTPPDAPPRGPLLGRADAWLLAGLVLAGVVAVVPPFPRLFAFIHEIERGWGLSLFPALVVLLIVLAAHVQRRRAEAGAHALALAHEATDAQQRARELEQLVAFGRSVSASLDLYALRRAIEAGLPRLAGGHDVWILLRVGERWESLSYVHPSSRPLDVREQERLAMQALAMLRDRPDDGPLAIEHHTCFALTAGDRQIGVMGVAALPGREAEGAGRLMPAVATLVAIGARNVEQVREIKDHGTRDALTGCFNRAQAIEVLGIELRRSLRSGLPLSVVMFDLDEFKQVNDVFGHLAGDAVLATVGQLMKRELRSSDVKCRYGGDEFLVILPETGGAPSRKVAESLREAMGRATVTFGDKSIHITSSLGVATASQGELSPEALIARADAALYAAKDSGRNCVRVATPPPASAPAPHRRSVPQWRPSDGSTRQEPVGDHRA